MKYIFFKHSNNKQTWKRTATTKEQAENVLKSWNNKHTSWNKATQRFEHYKIGSQSFTF